MKYKGSFTSWILNSNNFGIFIGIFAAFEGLNSDFVNKQNKKNNK